MTFEFNMSILTELSMQLPITDQAELHKSYDRSWTQIKTAGQHSYQYIDMSDHSEQSKADK